MSTISASFCNPFRFLFSLPVSPLVSVFCLHCWFDEKFFVLGPMFNASNSVKNSRFEMPGAIVVGQVTCVP